MPLYPYSVTTIIVLFFNPKHGIGLLTLHIFKCDGISYTITHDIKVIYYRYIVNIGIIFEQNILVRISFYHCIGDFCNRTGCLLDTVALFCFRIDTILLHQFHIVLFAFTDRITGCYNLIFLHIYHRIHFYQTRIIL